MNAITELKQKRAAIVKEQRDIINLVDKEQRDMTAEESQKYDQLNADFDALGEKIEKLEKDLEIRKQLKDREDYLQERKTDPTMRASLDNRKKVDPRSTDEYRAAYDSYLRMGRNGLFADELRALQVGTDSEGGYLVPDEFNRKLIEALYDVNVMRGLCTVITSSNGTMDIPVVSSQGAAAWTAEEAAFNESDDAFTYVQLSAYKLSRIIKVSEELLADSAFDMQSYLAQSFANAFGGAEETAFVTGNGTGKPTGITVSAGTGVTAASTSAVTADELINLYHSLARQYRSRAKFMMNDATALAIRKLKDGDNQYLWQPGLQAGEPDMLLGKPVVISHDMATMAASAKSVLFADFSYYWIADRSGRVFKRMDELYAANGQVGFRAHQRVDGKLTLAAAAKLIVQAAS